MRTRSSAPETFAKVAPVNRIEDRNLQPGPIAKRAYDLYFDFAGAGSEERRLRTAPKKAKAR